MTLNIELETEVDFDFDYEDIIKKVVEYSVDYVNCSYETQVNVTLTDNDNIHRINKEFRDIDRPTDVLSFPMVDYTEPENLDHVEAALDEYFDPDTGELLLGDIVISVEKVKEQAKEYGHSQLRELAFLCAHSMLHLFGHDHMEEDERIVMETKQKEILDALEIYR